MLGRGRVPRKLLTQFTAQLSTVVNAGLPLVRCLRILENQQKPGPFERVVTAVADDVESGAPLSEALAKYPQCFDRLYVNMVRAGEAGGVLGTILDRLATFAQKSQAVRGKVLSALLYPAVVLLVAVAAVGVVLIFVVPQFETIFESFGADLPGATRALMATSNWLTMWWWAVLAGLVLLVVCWRVALRNESFAYRIDALQLRLPIFGTLRSKTMIATFSRTMGTLLASGVPILEALHIVGASTRNLVLEGAIDDVHDAIREGESMADPLADSGVFDDVVVNMIDVGEETGQLDVMLLKLADIYEDEVDTAVAGALKALEPALIVFMAVFVGLIVTALFLPIVNIMSVLEGA